MLMQTHIHPFSAKRDAFSFQSQALFNGPVSPQFDRSTGSNNAMPGQIEATPKSRDYLSCRAGMPRGLRNSSVGGHVSLRDGTNGLQNVVTHRVSAFHPIRFCDAMRRSTST